MKRTIFCFCLLVFFISSCAHQDDFSVLKGPYLGQKPPGLTAEIFAPDLISTSQHEALYGFFENGTFLIFDRTDPSEKVWVPAVYVMELNEGSWMTTKGSPFRGKPWYHSYTIASEGKTVYFTWRGSLDKDNSSGDINIWMVKKGSQSWCDSTKLQSPVNSDSTDTYPSVTDKGTLYFFSGRKGGFGKGDIYRSRSNNGRHTDVENLGQTINTEYSDIDPFIAPDESYLIFCSNRPGGYGGLDFYISFQTENGSWTEPVNMGAGINSSGHEERPSVSPDGKYLFLTRDTSGNLDIYWVDARVIETFKPGN